MLTSSAPVTLTQQQGDEGLFMGVHMILWNVLCIVRANALEGIEVEDCASAWFIISLSKHSNLLDLLVQGAEQLKDCILRLVDRHSCLGTRKHIKDFAYQASNNLLDMHLAASADSIELLNVYTECFLQDVLGCHNAQVEQMMAFYSDRSKSLQERHNEVMKELIQVNKELHNLSLLRFQNDQLRLQLQDSEAQAQLEAEKAKREIAELRVQVEALKQALQEAQQAASRHHDVLSAGQRMASTPHPTGVYLTPAAHTGTLGQRSPITLDPWAHNCV